MIKFFIADHLSEDDQLKFTLNQTLKQFQQLPFTVLITTNEHIASLKKMIKKLWPQRGILVSDEPSHGCLCITDQYKTTSDPLQTCIINTNSHLMIAQKNCKVLIEIIYENRDAGRKKYKHHVQQGKKPDVEHIQ